MCVCVCVCVYAQVSAVFVSMAIAGVASFSLTAISIVALALGYRAGREGVHRRCSPQNVFCIEYKIPKAIRMVALALSI